MTLIYFLVVIGILVFVHEFGHFIMAKRAGVRVEKFSLGMGPRLFGYKKGDTDYIVSAADPVDDTCKLTISAMVTPGGAVTIRVRGKWTEAT